MHTDHLEDSAPAPPASASPAAKSLEEDAERLSVIRGPDIYKLTDEDWKLILGRHTGTVFARTTPQDKLYIVKQCQARGMR